MKIYLDGKFVSREDAKISVFDHGLLYGDGVFEGIRAYDGRVFRLREHIDRLYDSAKAIMLNVGLSKEEMMGVVLESFRINELKDGYVRLVVTRGVGDLGLNPNKCPKCSIFCIATGIAIYSEEVYEKGLKVVTASTRRIGPASLSAAIKSLNYLNQILARIEGNLAGADELVVLNEEGFVAECTADNIFVIKNGRLMTPPLTAGALGGITRRAVMDIASECGMNCVEVELTRYDLWVADEIFLTGTAAEVVPVREVDGRITGCGCKGEVTARFMDGFHKLTRKQGELIYP